MQHMSTDLFSHSGPDWEMRVAQWYMRLLSPVYLTFDTKRSSLLHRVVTQYDIKYTDKSMPCVKKTTYFLHIAIVGCR